MKNGRRFRVERDSGSIAKNGPLKNYGKLDYLALRQKYNLITLLKYIKV